jgi:hypothetical protein
MAKAIFCTNACSFNGHRHFRAGPEKVGVGAYGDKSVSPFNADYLDVSDRMDVAEVPMSAVGPIEIDFKKSTDTNGNALSPLKGCKIKAIITSRN